MSEANKSENPQFLFNQIPSEPTERRHFFNVQLIKGNALIDETRILLEASQESFQIPEYQSVEQMLGDDLEKFLDCGFDGLSNEKIMEIFHNGHLWADLNFLALSEGNETFWATIRNEAFPELRNRTSRARDQVRIRIQTGLNRDDLN